MNNCKKILISGASFAGLATAFWMTKLGCQVTIVEVVDGLKTGGTPVDIRDRTIDILKRMGLFKQIQAHRLPTKTTQFVTADDETGRLSSIHNDDQFTEIDYEIERDVLLQLMFDAVKDDVEFIFADSIASLEEENNGIVVSFKKGRKRSFDLVFGCDGVRSDVRKIWFGPETNFSSFLEAYGSVTIVDRLLIPESTAQLYNEPGKLVSLSAYNNKTDIILIFFSKEEIIYDHRDKEQKRILLLKNFSGVGWKTGELLEEVKRSDNIYFDKLSQIKMPSWTRGRVALVGDAAYCASPAAGRGGSLAIDGAAALAEAFKKHGDDFESAFREYDASFRPFIEEVQASAVDFVSTFIVPKTAEAIRGRNLEWSI